MTTENEKGHQGQSPRKAEQNCSHKLSHIPHKVSSAAEGCIKGFTKELSADVFRDFTG